MAMNRRIMFILVSLMVALSVFVFQGCSKDSTDVNNPGIIKPKVNITDAKSVSIFSDSLKTEDVGKGISIEWELDCGESGMETVVIQLFRHESDDPILDYSADCEEGGHLILGLEPGLYERLVMYFRDGSGKTLYTEEYVDTKADK